MIDAMPLCIGIDFTLRKTKPTFFGFGGAGTIRSHFFDEQPVLATYTLDNTRKLLDSLRCLDMDVGK